MATVTATEMVSLDGVMQAPGRADEDTRGGFRLGGWADGYADDAMMAFAAEGMRQTGAMLFGRRTYEDLLAAWTARAGDGNPFSDYLTDARKYVVSRSPTTRLAYPNSTLLAGDAAETVRTLTTQVDGSLSILGSGALVRSLLRAGLIDVLALSVYPVVLGSGTRLFDDVGLPATCTVQRSVVTGTGVVMAHYALTR